MAEDWLTDVRKYVSDADEKVVAKIVSYCGIALRNRDSSLVAFSDSAETDRVREKYLKKKLALAQDDATLDAGIAAVGERMKADRTKNRVTVYYLLAEHFGLLDVFGGGKRVTPNGVDAAAVATGAAGLAAVASASAPTSTASASTEPLSARGSSDGHGAPSQSGSSGARDDDGYLGWGCAVALLLLGAIIVAALLAKWADRPEVAPAPAAVAVAPAASPAPAAQAVPDGAGVVAGERDARPMLTVYFDTGRANVTPDFTTAAAPVLAYLAANPGASLAISGFNDPTGNAAANAELSKNRAQNVKAALEGLGVAGDRARLERPADTDTTGMSNSEARRVEVVVVGG